MQKWEYCKFSATHQGSKFEIKHLEKGITSNSKELHPNSVDQALVELGLEGWELCTIHQDPLGQTFYFKRPIED